MIPLVAVSSDAWVALIAAAFGYAVALATEIYRDRHQSGREREARKEARADARELREQEIQDRRAHFQRETLLELQEVLHHLGRTYGQEHHQDAMTAKAAGSWDPHQLVPGISERNLELGQRSNILVARVGDEAVRDAVREMKDAGNGLTFARSEEESDACLVRSLEAFKRANERIGILLREIL